MSGRALELHREAEAQVSALMELVRGADAEALRKPGSGREKLGDGTAATIVAFTTGNYGRIAGFAAGAGEQGAGHRGHHGDQAPGGTVTRRPCSDASRWRAIHLPGSAR